MEVTSLFILGVVCHVWQVKTRTRLLNEMKRDYPSTWLMLSDASGEIISEVALNKWMRQRDLSGGLPAVLTYLRGDWNDDGLVVQKSNIPAAGDGLFVTRRIRKGELICIYRGTRLSFSDVNKLDLKKGERDYVMGGFGGFLWHVDAGPHLNVKARYINDILTADGKHNVAFKKLRIDLSAKVEATRDIEADEELFVKYGRGYWSSRGIVAPYDDDTTE